MANRLTKKQLNKFQDAAESLKRYRRAELVNEANGAPLIEELCVDPLPNNHIFQTMLKANTTFLIGRKGTGKSTIFQRVQHELRKRPNHTSAYIDIKTVYESSRADPALIAKINANSDTLSKDSFEKLHLYRAFLRTIIKEIHQELRKRVESTPLLRIKRFFSGTIDELFEDLDALLEDIDKNHYSNMTGIRTVTVHETRGLSSEVDAEGTSSISLNSAAVKEAARKYYEEIIESFFTMNKYLLESYSERSSVLSLRELFENLTNRAKELRFHKNQEKNRGIRKSAVPTSHFYIVPEFESVLSTLELNFFITKYLELSDRGGRKVSVFALNYGLCQKLNIEFGRPEGTDFRNYFVKRIFDYTSILENYMTSNQEIKCDHCGSVFGQNELAILKRYRMKCPECSVGTCQVTNLSKKYKPLLSSFDQALVLPQIELGILQTLRTEKRPMLAKEIAATVDCTYQLVGKRGKSLAERELVEKIENKGQRWLKLTENRAGKPL
jgi:hypothetical protein